MSENLRAHYHLLRHKLETLQALPNKNLVEIDRLVYELERTQRAIKSELGIEGNNPNE